MVATFIVAQAGGPTAVVNASIVGALLAARSSPDVRRILGARFGIEGVLGDDCVDLTDLDEASIATLRRTPGAALGSGRHRPTDEEIGHAVEDLRRRDVRWVVAVGGNDTAESLHRLHLAARAVGIDIAFVGIPKTIDNDLPGMDHAPGYGSAARYLALAAREAALDTSAMRKTDPIKVIEVMGRNAGWLAASSALGREAPDDAPHVIFLPERPRSTGQMLAEIEAAQARHGWAIVVMSENQRDDQGAPIGGGQPVYVDPHGHPYFESAGAALVRIAQERLGLRTRYERPGSLQRTSALTLSELDLAEAEAAGAEAARLAMAGQSDIMVAIQRETSDSYRSYLSAVPLESVAHQERVLPAEFIDPSGINVSEAFLTYGRPLIGGPFPPRHVLL
jgi:6-phosphofructokinase 1